MNRTRPPARPGRRRAGLLPWWTLSRVTVIGIVFGLFAVLIASLVGTPSETMLRIYAVTLAVTALCGASILWITASDMRTRGTSGRMRPIRSFDVAIGLTLLVPALYAFAQIRVALGL